MTRGSSGGGVALLLFSILTFSSPNSSGMVLPGFVSTSTGCLTLSIRAAGRTLGGGRSHLDLDDLRTLDLICSVWQRCLGLDGSSRTSVGYRTVASATLGALASLVEAATVP